MLPNQLVPSFAPSFFSLCFPAETLACHRSVTLGLLFLNAGIDSSFPSFSKVNHHHAVGSNLEKLLLLPGLADFNSFLICRLKKMFAYLAHTHVKQNTSVRVRKDEMPQLISSRRMENLNFKLQSNLIQRVVVFLSLPLVKLSKPEARSRRQLFFILF